jgi:hypothetical protein
VLAVMPAAVLSTMFTAMKLALPDFTSAMGALAYT